MSGLWVELFVFDCLPFETLSFVSVVKIARDDTCGCHAWENPGDFCKGYPIARAFNSEHPRFLPHDDVKHPPGVDFFNCTSSAPPTDSVMVHVWQFTVSPPTRASEIRGVARRLAWRLFITVSGPRHQYTRGLLGVNHWILLPGVVFASKEPPRKYGRPSRPPPFEKDLEMQKLQNEPKNDKGPCPQGEQPVELTEPSEVDLKMPKAYTRVRGGLLLWAYTTSLIGFQDKGPCPQGEQPIELTEPSEVDPKMPKGETRILGLQDKGPLPQKELPVEESKDFEKSKLCL
ncbi:uncharacterized protein LACBIDRAFT_328947 [Laccaria bicolor S238N-H82]|uniref:Predicted protein n=1 Tax=Laccaria bicolor (strain S238N-H82 / ATCC MYA-4686) TaxID=486041 RepID=B0DGI9_LACBS|nr:uncharacterized protein LACBIDRAFT_328947 [Laccaria bicolor S238N-H82]EDR06278.1 predicted protein [Laccaria bicolor S238N-H82]|eukprot:XP_001883139.1 predicted protein [Laccaria bicolor S238N-H82]